MAPVSSSVCPVSLKIEWTDRKRPLATLSRRANFFQNARPPLPRQDRRGNFVDGAGDEDGFAADDADLGPVVFVGAEPGELLDGTMLFSHESAKARRLEVKREGAELGSFIESDECLLPTHCGDYSNSLGCQRKSKCKMAYRVRDYGPEFCS